MSAEAIPMLAYFIEISDNQTPMKGPKNEPPIIAHRVDFSGQNLKLDMAFFFKIVKIQNITVATKTRIRFAESAGKSPPRPFFAVTSANA